MNKTSIILLTAAAIGTSIFAAHASEGTTTGAYAVVEGGYSLPNKKTKSYTVNKKLKAGSVWGIGAGYKVNENLRTALVFNYRPDFKYKAVDADKVSYKQKVKSMSLMLNAYYDIMPSETVSPYATAGIGFAKNTAGKLTLSASNGTTRYTAGKSKTSFAYQVGTGAVVKLSSNVDLDFGYRYVDLGKFTTKNIGSDNLNHKPSKGRLTAHEFLVGFKYNF